MSIELDDELTILMVGDREPLADALRAAMERRGLNVERVASVGSTQAAIAVAPDLILLVGDATESGGTDILGRLSASTLAAVIPVVLLSDDEGFADRLRAFRFGATAVVARTASADAIAARVSELAHEIPERQEAITGEIGEATLEEFAKMLTRELRQGILSVRAGDDEGVVRVVLGEGKQLAEVVESFVSRVRPLVRKAEVVRYEFQEHPTGSLSLLGPDLIDGTSVGKRIAGLRVLLADDDVARADAVAQELREHGATVVMTDLTGSRLDRARSYDPSVLVIDEKAIEGSGYQLVRRMREDIRLRWTAMLVVSWDEIWGQADRGPVVASLTEKLARFCEAEHDLIVKARDGETFDVRLDAFGPARLLRALVASERRLKVSVQGRRMAARVDLTDGLVAGVIADLKEGDAAHLEGPLALAALLGMGSGRVRVEPVEAPASASLMTTIDVALSQADGESSPFRPSEQPRSLPAGPGPLVGGARLTPPEPAAVRHKGTLQGFVPPPPAKMPIAGLKTNPGLKLPQARPAPKTAPGVGVPAPIPAPNFPSRRRGGEVAETMLDEGPRPAKPMPKTAPGVGPPSEPPAKPLAVVSAEPRARKRRHNETLVGMPVPTAKDDSAPSLPKAAVPAVSARIEEPSAEDEVESASTQVTAVPRELLEEHLAASAHAEVSVDDDEVVETTEVVMPEHREGLEKPLGPAPVEVPAISMPAPAPISPTPTAAKRAPFAATIRAMPAMASPSGAPMTSPASSYPAPEIHLATTEPPRAPAARPDPFAPTLTAMPATTTPQVAAAPADPFAVQHAASPFDTAPLAPPQKKSSNKKTIFLMALGAFALAVGGGVTAYLLMPAPVAPPENPAVGTEPTTGEPTAVAVEEPAGNGTATESGSTGTATQAGTGGETPTQAGAGGPTSLASLGITIPAAPRHVARMSEASRLRESRRLRAQGRRLTQRRRWSAAERTFEEALMFTPDDPWVYRDLAVFEFRQGELDRAEAWARAAIEKDPNEEQFYITLGDTLGAKRDLAGARIAWEQALRLNRRSRAAQRRLDRLGRP